MRGSISLPGCTLSLHEQANNQSQSCLLNRMLNLDHSSPLDAGNSAFRGSHRLQPTPQTRSATNASARDQSKVLPASSASHLDHVRRHEQIFIPSGCTYLQTAALSTNRVDFALVPFGICTLNCPLLAHHGCPSVNMPCLSDVDGFDACHRVGSSNAPIHATRIPTKAKR